MHRDHRMKALGALLLGLSMAVSMLVFVPGATHAAPSDGWIEGTVTDGVNPIPNVMLIYILNMGGGGNPLGSGWTDALGHYNMTVTGGLNYLVLAFEGNYYSNMSTAVVVSGATTIADIVLTPIAPMVADVTLHGFVKDELGNPVAVGSIIGYANDPLMTGGGPPYYGNSTVPDAFGEYFLNVIPGAKGGGVGIMDVPGYGFTENSSSEPFVSGMTYWFNLTLGISVSTDDAVLRGTVTEYGTGLPLENVLVSIESSNAWNQNRSYSNFTFTDSVGSYQMNVTNGTSRMMYSKVGYSMIEVKDVIIDPSDMVTIDVQLRKTVATIRGNVTDKSDDSPIANAQVFLTDMMGNLTMTSTDPSGAYVLDAFAGTDLALGAQADGYVRDVVMASVSPGDTLWQDFRLGKIDAWLAGRITDAITGAPIENANINVYNGSYNEWANTNIAGDYNITALMSGNYSISINAMNYRQFFGEVQVLPGGTVYDVQLMPWDIPNTCRLYGWINDSDTGSPLSGARMEIGIGPEEHSETSSIMTDGSGYYEMWIPAIPLIWVASAGDHEHASGSLDATGLTEVEVSTSLVPDTWMPNITRWDQNPLENVSTVNPSVLDVEFDEDDVSSMQLFYFGFWYNDGMWDYFINIHFLYTNFDPLASPSDSVPYTVVGDHYTVHEEWTAQTTGGLLWNGTDSQYLPCWTISYGPYTYDALRGQYMNATSPFWQSGTMYFDRDTGSPYTYQFDMGGPQADLSDPTGVFAPEAQVAQKDPGSSSIMGIWNQDIGQWSVSGLQFAFDTTVPSGEYLMVFGVSDWGNHGMGDIRLLTVDTDPPVADAGPDQTADVGIPTMLDGTGSSDNVGIVSYTWEYIDDLGATVVLYGATVSATFNAGGSYDVTLTVRDAAGYEDSDTLTVTVGDNEPPVAEAGPDQLVMSGELVYLDASASSDNYGIVNWTWTFTSDGVDYTLWGENVSFIFGLDPETVLVTLTVTDASGNSDSDTMIVNVSGMIPEFSTLLIPISGMLLLIVIVGTIRRRRQ